MPRNLKSLRTPATLDELTRLRSRIATHVDLLDEQSLDLEHVQVQLGRAIAQVLIQLIDAASTFDAEARALLRGAIGYFVLTGDQDDDIDSPNGLEDDAEIVNELCVSLGRPELQIKR